MGPRGGAVCEMWHPSPTSQGLSKRQLASLQVPLRHKPPPTQPGHHRLSARVIQGGLRFKNTHQHASSRSVSTKSRRARKRLPGAGGLELMGKMPTPTSTKRVCLSGLNLARTSTWLFSFPVHSYKCQVHSNPLICQGRGPVDSWKML